MADEALSWSYIADAVGDMYNEEEYGPLLMELPDGRIVHATAFVKRDGEWLLIGAEDRPQSEDEDV